MSQLWHISNHADQKRKTLTYQLPMKTHQMPDK